MEHPTWPLNIVYFSQQLIFEGLLWTVHLSPILQYCVKRLNLE